MNRFNTSSTHPIIPNSQQYIFEKKFISISSEDRDITKYPSSSSFEIELPQDYLNIQTVKLNTWFFPNNYSVFTSTQYNTTIIFSITTPYNYYNSATSSNSLQYAIYLALTAKIGSTFTATIDDGTYTADQLAIALTRAMNKAITDYIITYLTSNGYTDIIDVFLLQQGYNEFIVIYDSVKMKLLFGNKSSQFAFNNDSIVYTENKIMKNITCKNKNTVEQFINWGLPYYLGFTRNTVEAETTTEDIYTTSGDIIYLYLPRLNYGEYATGDNGYWLVPNLPYAKVYFLETPQKINITGYNYFFIDITGYNNIDITYPFNISRFTNETNQTNGVVNGAFAKIYMSQLTSNEYWFNDDQNASYKYFHPPAERIRRLSVKLLYHDGSLVDFQNNNYTFTLELGILRPQSKRDFDVYIPENLITYR